jgi:hypothetical protein
MRILVTGSRDWTDRDSVWSALSRHASVVGVTVVHGDRPTGADAFAQRWTEHQPDVTPEAHPADWEAHGRAAGPLRNKEMVSLGADLCLAFIGDCSSPRCNIGGKHPSHGASGCADLAETAGIPTVRHYP